MREVLGERYRCDQCKRETTRDALRFYVGGGFLLDRRRPPAEVMLGGEFCSRACIGGFLEDALTRAFGPKEP